MPLASSSLLMNATRTTKVAPCNSCAGPKTSPRKEWAIMIWSDTSTAYTNLLPAGSRIADQWTARVAVGGEYRRQARGKFGKRHRRREQGVERRVGQQRQRRREPLPMGPARPMRRRDLSDLAGNEPQPPAVEG